MLHLINLKTKAKIGAYPSLEDLRVRIVDFANYLGGEIAWTSENLELPDAVVGVIFRDDDSPGRKVAEVVEAGPPSFLITGEHEDPTNGARVQTFEIMAFVDEIEAFITTISETRRHRGVKLPDDWRERLVEQGMIELDGGVMIMGDAR